MEIVIGGTGCSCNSAFSTWKHWVTCMFGFPNSQRVAACALRKPNSSVLNRLMNDQSARREQTTGNAPHIPRISAWRGLSAHTKLILLTALISDFQEYRSHHAENSLERSQLGPGNVGLEQSDIVSEGNSSTGRDVAEAPWIF